MTWRTLERKFVKGGVVPGIHDVIDAVNAEHYLMFNHKPMHPSVVRNWSIVQIENACLRGVLHYAMPNPKHPDNLCTACGVNPRDFPSPFCPGCEAYQEHQV